MNKLYFLLAVIFLSSCANKKQSERERFISDSLRNEFIKDSIANDIKNDSLALIAWGDARFGMTKDECLNTYSFGNGSNYDTSIEMDIEIKWDFAEAFGVDELYKIEALFRGKDNNELIMVQIKSYNVYANKFDNLVRTCNAFKEQFIDIYGNPYYENDIDFMDMNNGEEEVFAYWTINSLHNGTKYIWIFLGEVDDGSEYYYKLRISNSDFPKSEYEPTEDEIKLEKEKQERINKIKSSSF